MKKFIFSAALLWAFLAIDLASFGQYSQAITNAQLAGTSNNVTSGANFNFLAGSDLFYSSESATSGQLFYIGASNKVLPLTLGSGLSISAGTLVSASSSSADPSATIGLTAVNGSASSFMTSDSAPALSQAIVPTWTGLHDFSITSAITTGSDYGIKITPTLNQRNATNFSLIFGNETVTQAGTGNQYLEQLQIGGTDEWIVDSTGTVQKGTWNGTGIALTQIASFATGNVLGNNTGSSGPPIALTPSNVLDMIDNTQGDVIYRGATGWTFLSPGTSGQFLTSGGSAANVSWTTGGSVSGPSSSTSGAIATWNGTSGTTLQNTSVTVSTATVESSGTNDLSLGTAAEGVGLVFSHSATTAAFGSSTDVFMGSFGAVVDSSNVTLSIVGQSNAAIETSEADGTPYLKMSTGTTYRGWLGSISMGAALRLTAGTNMDLFLGAGDSSSVGIGITHGTGATTISGPTTVTGAITANSGNLTTATIGFTLSVKSGSNAKSGSFTLVAGAATVANTSITTHSVIHASLQAGSASGTITGSLYYPSVTVSTGFTVAEVGGITDTNTYNYWIEENN